MVLVNNFCNFIILIIIINYSIALNLIFIEKILFRILYNWLSLKAFQTIGSIFHINSIAQNSKFIKFQIFQKKFSIAC
jgi:hypothetical protein